MDRRRHRVVAVATGCGGGEADDVERHDSTGRAIRHRSRAPGLADEIVPEPVLSLLDEHLAGAKDENACL